MDLKKPPTARNSTRWGAIPIVRAFWIAVAGMVLAVVLPAAISLASTGTLGAYSVVGAITGSKPTADTPSKREHTERPATPVPPAGPSDADDLGVLSKTSNVVPDRSADDREGGKARLAG